MLSPLSFHRLVPMILTAPPSHTVQAWTATVVYISLYSSLAKCSVPIGRACTPLSLAYSLSLHGMRPCSCLPPVASLLFLSLFLVYDSLSGRISFTRMHFIRNYLLSLVFLYFDAMAFEERPSEHYVLQHLTENLMNAELELIVTFPVPSWW